METHYIAKGPDVFFQEFGRAFQDDLELLRVLKQLKYFWNLPSAMTQLHLQHVRLVLHPQGHLHRRG